MNNTTNYKDLYQRFKNSGLPINYTWEEISEAIKNTFKAREISKKDFFILDSTITKRHLQKVFIIDNPEVLSNLFNIAEKSNHEMEKRESELDPEDLSLYTEHELPSVNMWKDIREGKQLNIILYKKILGKNKFSYTLQGESRRVLLELDVLMGTRKVDIEDEDFQTFLDNLDELGRI